MEFHEIIRYMYRTGHILTRWLSLFKGVESLGADDCPAASWIIISFGAGRRNRKWWTAHHSRTVFIFHSRLHVIYSRYSSQAGEQVNSFLWSLLNHDKVSRFAKEEERRQFFLAWSKNYLGLTCSSDWQIRKLTQDL